MTSEEAKKIFSPYLYDYEKQEIMEFPTVYFFNV